MDGFGICFGVPFMKFIKPKCGKILQQFDEIFPKLEFKHVLYQIRAVNHQSLSKALRGYNIKISCRILSKQF